ncbi:MAG: 30S ribosomal protein S1 [Anaerolineae bacterium]
MQEGVNRRFPADGPDAEAEEPNNGDVTAGVTAEAIPQERVAPQSDDLPPDPNGNLLKGEEENSVQDDEMAPYAAEVVESSLDLDPAAIPPLKRPGLEESGDEEFSTMEELLQQEEYGMVQPRRGDVLTGRVISATSEGLLVDVGLKREGVVPAADLSRLDAKARSNIKVGDEIPVYVLRASDQDGNLILSVHRAQSETDWLRAQQMKEQEELWEGKVTGYNQGGLVVPFGRIRGFLPASQIVGFPRRLTGEARTARLAKLVGETLPLKVVEVDRRRRRLIFSHRAAWWEWKEHRRQRLLEEIQEGEVRRGIVSSLRDFGAFVDLGGVDGLIHVSELSWERVEHPRDVLKVGDEIDVYVLNVDRAGGRIGLSLKRLIPEPWSQVPEKYHVNQLVEGVVTRVTDFGVFVKLEEGIEGLIHRSELADIEPQRPRDLVKEGDLLLLRVIRVEPERRRIGLSLRQVSEEEWSHWAASYHGVEAPVASADPNTEAAPDDAPLTEQPPAE